jgi:hypothetical protein
MRGSRRNPLVRLDSIARTTVGGLILGYDFVWSDPACYAADAGLGVVIGMTTLHDRSAPRT